ncbi:hypothetical protein HNY73_003296 [Argiope bruennichi]|uniref:Uncharacterized protein n=1 Tax=Argiope bruennichi TaxID=94029 RepID=A0A8T0FWJ6_ARGBR|nr:hypothetical protein HNY73_003296 [Argiope bruennichi]
MEHNKGFSNTHTSLYDSSHRSSSSDSLNKGILSELDDFIPDRNPNIKYSYSLGGFYIPNEREAIYNYYFEEVTGKDDKHEHNSDKGSVKDSDSKILTGSSQTATYYRKTCVFIGSQESFPESSTTTIASGFARSLDGDTVLHVEQVLDVINKFGVRSIEDPKC